MVLKKFLKNIDTYSDYFYFTYQGNEKFKTVIGGFFTIISFILIFFFAIILGSDIYFKVNPKISSQEINMPHPPITLFNHNTTLFAFYIDHYYYSDISTDGYLTILPSISQKLTVKGEQVNRLKYLKYEKCNDEIQKQIPNKVNQDKFRECLILKGEE